MTNIIVALVAVGILCYSVPLLGGLLTALVMGIASLSTNKRAAEERQEVIDWLDKHSKGEHDA